MKRIALLLVLTLLLSCPACGKSDTMYPDRTLLEKSNQEDSWAEFPYDLLELHGAVEIADLIILGTVTAETADPPLTPRIRGVLRNGPAFGYEIKVNAIWFDREATAKVGDTLSLSSGFGMIQCLAWHELNPDSDLPDTELAADSYYTYHLFGGLPIEQGYQYVFFLDSEPLEDLGIYQDASLKQVYGVQGETVYFGTECKRWGTLTELKESVDLTISLRTGEMDDGWAAYFGH